MGCSMRRWKQRYSDWVIWCQYTNDSWIQRVGALFGFATYATISFHAFRATLRNDWRNK